jgi:predicted phosphodiesterase
MSGRPKSDDTKARATPLRDLSEAGEVALISCIHGNMEALEAVWSDIRACGISEVICLGDLVGYGPHPAEVVDFIRREGIPTIRGCWDEGVAEQKGDCGCHFVAEDEKAAGDWSYRWTQEHLTDRHRQFLASLPPMIAASANGSRLLAVHGSPRNAHEYLTETTHELVLYERAGSAQADILVFGHTHVPYVKRIAGDMRVTLDTAAPAEGSAPSESEPLMKSMRPKLFINAGSVGEPRHGSPEATYVIFSPGLQEVRIRYVDYDVAKTTAAMRRSEMPAAFAERLALGRELAVKNKSLPCVC